MGDERSEMSVTTFEPDPAAIRALENVMAELSEMYSASWIAGVEFTLWGAIQGHTLWHGDWVIPEELVTRAERLSRAIQGWVTWPDEWERPRYVPMSDWLQRWAERPLP